MNNFSNELKKVSVFTIEHSGYAAKIMKAKRLVGDFVHGLPAGKPIGCIPIKCLPGVPENWVQRAGTYVVQIDAESGFWFDWTMNDQYNTAVISSVKGINPITGIKIEEIKLEQYRDKCPIHGCDFSHNNFCTECGYNFPYQNYISYPNIPLWQDGFRQADGSIRQFFFSEEDKRDVASAIIGKKNTIPAFGFAFYRCKNNRRPEVFCGRTRGVLLSKYGSLPDDVDEDCLDFSLDNIGGGSLKYYTYTNDNTNLDNESFKGFCTNDGVMKGSTHIGTRLGGGEVTKGCSDTLIGGLNSVYGPKKTSILSSSWSCSSSSSSSKGSLSSNSNTELDSRICADHISNEIKKFSEEPQKAKERFNKDVSVGAGAKIRQNLQIDTTPIEEWGREPEAVITLYFVFSEQLEAIIEKGGIKPLENNPAGFLDKVLVG